ncbi:hypothetical protein [uncultured Nitrospira sp.]|uniref:hypothetical protein n=1 Tax=uncultured Nitrospira sp. TaxID=157176 RepID=UPI00313FF854
MRVSAVDLSRITLAGVVACTFLLSCTGSGIRTPLHQNETSRVYLEWVPQESFRASHPANLPPTVIHAALRGLRVQKRQTGLGELLHVQQKPKRMFSDEDVEFLTPHILSALSLATPEEQIVFQRIYPWEYGSRMTAGTLSLREDLLFLTITHYTQKHEGINLVYVDDRQAPDPTGLGGQTVLFVPKETLRPDKSPQEPGHPDEVTLAINYPLLESMQKAREESAPSPIRQTETPSITGNREDVVSPITQKGLPDTGETSSTNPALRALEKQVHKQEQELKELKNELQEIQRSRDPQ